MPFSPIPNPGRAPRSPASHTKQRGQVSAVRAWAMKSEKASSTPHGALGKSLKAQPPHMHNRDSTAPNPEDLCHLKGLPRKITMSGFQ